MITISCVKFGDKFTYKHVNRLYKMCCNNFKKDFTFVCHTEDDYGINGDIIINPLDTSLGLKAWWWKLTLFSDYFHLNDIHTKRGKHLFFDLDVVIQKDFTHFLDYIEKDKLTMIEAYWKDYPVREPDMNYNSSVLAWEGKLDQFWKDFDSERTPMLFNGIDGYLYNQHPEHLKVFPREEIYSRLFGVDEDENFRPINDNKPEKLFYKPEYPICIFNGWRREKYPDGSYWLDDDGYNGMENYYNFLNSPIIHKDHRGIDESLLKEMRECVNLGKDIHHFFDSLSDSQYQSKLWLCNSLYQSVGVEDITKIKIFGGWFLHPLLKLLKDIYRIEWIENVDIDEYALNVSRRINNTYATVDTKQKDCLEPDERDWDCDLVINTSSEHMPSMKESIEKRRFRKVSDNIRSKPCLFAVQSNNMFHIDDHINCVNNEDELAENVGLKRILYKGSLDMPNGYKRFMVIGYA